MVPDDVDTAVRPIATSTGSVPAQSLAVGDVTGDGRADMVITKQQFGDFDVAGQFRDYLFAQFFDSRGAAPFRSNGLLDGGFGAVVASSTPVRSDAMLMDLNDDRFPEIVIASPFIGGTGGIRAWRMNCLLDNANLATFVDSYSFSYTTGVASPHRLASGSFQSSRAEVLLASGDNAEAVQFVFSTYSPSSKTYDLITGASTDSDENGSSGNNGVYTYEVDVGGVITYSLHYVNNTTTAVAGAVVECPLPSSLSVMSGDVGYTVDPPAGPSKFIRWNLGDVAAGSSGVKTFSVRVLSGRTGLNVALKGNFKRGTTVLVTKPMPVVELQEPLDVDISRVITTSSPVNGNRTHRWRDHHLHPPREEPGHRDDQRLPVGHEHSGQHDAHRYDSFPHDRDGNLPKHHGRHLDQPRTAAQWGANQGSARPSKAHGVSRQEHYGQGHRHACRLAEDFNSRGECPC